MVDPLKQRAESVSAPATSFLLAAPGRLWRSELSQIAGPTSLRRPRDTVVGVHAPKRLGGTGRDSFQGIGALAELSQ